MVKKVIHCSDIHIRTFRQHDEYREIFEKFYEECSNICHPYQFDEVRIVVVGDLFHQKITISNESLILASEFLRNLSNIAPTIIVAGNHDLLENNRDRMDSITPVVRLLNEPHLHYYTECECYLDDNIVWCNYSIFEGNARPDIELAKVKHGLDKKYIGLFHAPIVNAVTDIGYKFDSGTSVDHFEGLDAVMCGDIHKRQNVGKKSQPVVYPSSCIQQDFGETVSGHGFVVWDIETMTYEEVDIENPHSSYLFEINSIDDVENNKEKFKNP